MGMTFYAAHVIVESEEDVAGFGMSFPNEMEPEMLIKDSFIKEFADSKARKTLITNSFDANYYWEDEEPYTLQNAVDDWWDDCDIPWFDDEIVSELDEEEFIPNKFKNFCQSVEKMNSINYVLLAVDADKPSHNYGEFWYDAVVYDFIKNRYVKIEWRGDFDTHKELYGQYPFDGDTAEEIIELLKNDKIDSIDVGDFVLNGALYGKVTEKKMQENSPVKKAIGENTPEVSPDPEEAKQIERISSLIKNVDSIDFTNKAFVFDRLEYVQIGSEWHGPDSREHPIVKSVIEAGGLMRQNVSGKTNYLVLNNHAVMSGMGKKCRDALTQIDKGKDIKIITVENLLDVLGK